MCSDTEMQTEAAGSPPAMTVLGRLRGMSGALPLSAQLNFCYVKAVPNYSNSSGHNFKDVNDIFVTVISVIQDK